MIDKLFDKSSWEKSENELSEILFPVQGNIDENDGTQIKFLIWYTNVTVDNLS